MAAIMSAKGIKLQYVLLSLSKVSQVKGRYIYTYLGSETESTMIEFPEIRSVKFSSYFVLIFPALNFPKSLFTKSTVVYTRVQ